MVQLNKIWRKEWVRRSLVMLIGLMLWFGFFGTSPAMASLVTQAATEVKVSLGNTANELKFFPNQLEFIADRPYKLIISNPSPQKHYFTAKDFADAIWTSKVEDGQLEVKGAIREVELQPGAEAEWVFIPLKSGTYSLRCPIAGHTEAGMTGQIIVSAQ